MIRMKRKEPVADEYFKSGNRGQVGESVGADELWIYVETLRERVNADSVEV